MLYNYSRWNTRGDAGFYEGIKGGFLKTMKVEGAQGAEARTAEDGRGEKLKADGGGEGVMSG